MRARLLDRLDDRRALVVFSRLSSSVSLRWPSASIGTFSALAIVKTLFSKPCPGVPAWPAIGGRLCVEA